MPLTPQQLADFQRLRQSYAPVLEAQRRKQQAQGNLEKMHGLPPVKPQPKADGGSVKMSKEVGNLHGIKNLSFEDYAPNEVELVNLEAHEQGKGHGSNAMQKITSAADKHKINLMLIPAGDKSKRDRLSDFYGRFGFSDDGDVMRRRHKAKGGAVFERGEMEYEGGIPNKSDGEAGHGIYAYPSNNSAMRKYYTSRGENVVSIEPNKDAVITDFTDKNFSKMAIDEARRISPSGKTNATHSTIQRHPWALKAVAEKLGAHGYLVPHSGPGIPSGKQLVITDEGKFSYKKKQIAKAKGGRVTHAHHLEIEERPL